MNGIKIAHFASQGVIPDEATLNALRGTDILIIQAFSDHSQFTLKLSVDECVSIIKWIHPRIAILAHGTKDIGVSVAYRMGVKLEYPGEGELRLSRSDLMVDGQIRVMDLDTTVAGQKINFQ